MGIAFFFARGVKIGEKNVVGIDNFFKIKI